MKRIYSQLYRLFDDCTPLKADCGKACDGACCTDEGGEGMLLYPGEQVMLKKADFLTLEQSEFTVEGNKVPIAICKGSCNRRFRPLACRIFPLFPYVKPGSRPVVIMDPRANAICPIARVMKPSDLEQQFVRRVNLTANLLYLIPKTRKFMEEQSKLLDDMCGSAQILSRILSD
ncbi:MAG: hypothetical protein E7399_07175 [Ruminococcaceae bacterium]|nr:hypothetical protein [Oscillospiraceae bacterium]